MRPGLQVLRSVVFIGALLFVGRAWAQTSVNAVGYVQVSFAPGYTFCCNPLHTTNDTVRNLIPVAPDSCAVYLWDVDAQRFSAPSVYHNGWSSNYAFAMGKGFVVYTPTPFTNTFVGEVLQGHLINPIAGNNRFSLIASLVPQAGTLTTLELPSSEGDTVIMPKSSGQGLADACSYFGGYGWFDPAGVADTNGPTLSVASCFFMQHAGPDTSWARDFSVNNGAQFIGPIPATINSIRISGNTATLNVTVVAGATYSVQTSADRITWTTVATKQIASVWTYNLAGQPSAYFRLR
jgi:hypothetical protein